MQGKAYEAHTLNEDCTWEKGSKLAPVNLLHDKWSHYVPEGFLQSPYIDLGKISALIARRNIKTVTTIKTQVQKQHLN